MARQTFTNVKGYCIDKLLPKYVISVPNIPNAKAVNLLKKGFYVVSTS